MADFHARDDFKRYFIHICFHYNKIHVWCLITKTNKKKKITFLPYKELPTF